MLSWLIEAGVGPALVAVPVNWAADALADSAKRWFGRIGRADGLSRLVAAAGQAVVLTPSEFRAVRHLLGDESTWRAAGQGRVEDLVARIARCIPSGEERTREASHAAARVIARGVLEFAVADLDPAIFQQVLLARLQRLESNMASALDEVMLGLHADLAAQFAGRAAADGQRLDRVMGCLKRVLEHLPYAPAGRAEIAVYLRTLIDWLGTDPWPRDQRFRGPALSPAAIERKLRVRTSSKYSSAKSNVGTNDADADADADFLAADCRRLVVLGGPGSGKTWLARRIARLAAEQALSALAAGAGLEEVELPLYTTCARLTDALGDIRAAVVSSALDQIGDLGGSRISSSVRAFLAERNAPTVLVIDSLDEARGADDRLRQADTLPWRIILTSRPGSWNSQLSFDSEDNRQRIGVLQPLRYPEDVELLINRWFAGTPVAGERLVKQIAKSAALQRSAAVPLILSFYCLIGGDAPLPDSRRQLYDKVIRRLLTSRWRGPGDRQPDADACIQVLRSWAWHGAADSSVSGTGIWPDDILAAPSRLSRADDSALDCIAMPVAPPDVDSGLTLRRFIHRAVREYLVSEYVAGLPSVQAAAVLLPHLWYDEDWYYPAAMTIAAHPQRNALLPGLLRAAGATQVPANLQDIDVAWQMRGLLARVANESSEADWAPEIAETIRLARLQLAKAGRPQDLDGPAGWATAVLEERHVLLQGLTEGTGRYESHVENNTYVGYPDRGTGRAEFAAILSAVTRLTLTPEDGDDVCLKLFGLMARAHDSREGFFGESSEKTALALSIVHFYVASEDRARSRAILLRILGDPSAGAASAEFVDGLVRLAQTEDDKRQTVNALLSLAAGESRMPVAAALAAGATRISTNLEDRAQALQLLLTMLAHECLAQHFSIPEVVRVVALLASSLADKNRARMAMFRILADLIANLRSANPEGDLSRILGGIARAGESLADGIMRLDPTYEEKRLACNILLQVMSDLYSCSEWYSRFPLADILIALGATKEERRQARQILMRAIFGDRPDKNGRMYVKGEEVKAIAALSVDTDEKAETLQTLLLLAHRCLRQSGVENLADGIVSVALTHDSKLLARQVLIQILADEIPHAWDADLAAIEVVDAFGRLNPLPGEYLTVCELLLRRIPQGAPTRFTENLVRSAERLAVTTESVRAVNETLLDLLAQPAYAEIGTSLAQTVAKLAIGSPDQQHVREALLNLLGQPVYAGIGSALARAVASLAGSLPDKQYVREALLANLRSIAGNPESGIRNQAATAVALAEGITGLDPQPHETQHVRQILIRILLSTTDDTRLGKPDRVISALWLTEAIDHLNLTSEETRTVRQVLLTWISAQTCPEREKGQSTCDREVEDLVHALLQFNPTDDDKRAACMRLISCLSAEYDGDHAEWQVRALLTLKPTAADIVGISPWKHAPPTSLLRFVRSNTTPQNWLAELPSMSALTRCLYWGPRGDLLET